MATGDTTHRLLELADQMEQLDKWERDQRAQNKRTAKLIASVRFANLVEAWRLCPSVIKDAATTGRRTIGGDN